MDTSNSHILTINGGSSSIKFSVFNIQTKESILSGKIDHVGTEKATISFQGEGEEVIKSLAGKDHFDSLVEILSSEIDPNSLVAVGHRVVHGGTLYQAPIQITDEVLNNLQSLTSFAPHHLPDEILLIEKMMGLFPKIPHIACFDTSFFRDLPRLAQLLPIPAKYQEKGIRRYGFHGLSYEYLTNELKEKLGNSFVAKKIILAHLGSGVSLTAISDGKPIETTMGLTPNSGAPMATRTGDIDPGFYEYCRLNEGMTSDEFSHLVNYESGYLGLSQMTADMETLIQKAYADTKAEEAVAFFCYHIKKHIGALAATMNGVDCIVFSGGMGEHAPEIRRRICEGLIWLGIELDYDANTSNEICISGADSRVILYVIPANEEHTIVQQVISVLA